MRYLSMIRIDENSGRVPSEKLMNDMGRLIDEMTSEGTLIRTGGLRPTAEGARVCWRGGKLSQVDGPFAETKEVVGGFAILETVSMPGAIELTERFLRIHGDEWDIECEVRQLDGPEFGSTVTNHESVRDVVRAAYAAYETKSRAMLESLLSDDFHFTSPLDNRLDRETYFRICWPNSERIAEFRFVNLVVDGERAFVTYDGRCQDGRRFRNTEIVTVRNGKIVEVEVYFGWSIPHSAPSGTHVDEATGDR